MQSLNRMDKMTTPIGKSSSSSSSAAAAASSSSFLSSSASSSDRHARINNEETASKPATCATEPESEPFSE